MEFTKSQKSFLIIALCLLFGAIVGGGVYIYSKDPFGFKIPKLDKYGEILEWCDSDTKIGVLDVSCKALLVEIYPGEGSSTCFNTQIITSNKKLEDLEICETNDDFTYTNEILGYTKLMPINVDFNYSGSKIFNSYVLSGVSFKPMNQEVLNSMVNDDIAELITMDTNTTTIKNSIDFCPIPSTLPGYISEANKANFSDFYTKEKSQEEATNKSIYDTNTGVLNLFLTCYPGENCNYSILSSISQIANSASPSPVWGKELSNYDYDALAQLTYLYAGEDIVLPTYSLFASEATELHIVTRKEAFVKIINLLSYDQTSSEEVYCTVYQAVNASSKANSNELTLLKNTMQRNINDGLSQSTFPLCYDVLDTNDYSKNGIYIMYLMSIKEDSLKILNRCLNLNRFLQ